MHDKTKHGERLLIKLIIHMCIRLSIGMMDRNKGNIEILAFEKVKDVMVVRKMDQDLWE